MKKNFLQKVNAFIVVEWLSNEKKNLRFRFFFHLALFVIFGTALTRPTEDLCSRRTRKATAAFASYEENWLYFRGVNGPPLQTHSKITILEKRVLHFSQVIALASIHLFS